MRFHIDWVKGFRPKPPLQITGPPPHDAKSAELLSQDDGNTDDSPMITAVYETHLSMEKLLAALAELRGDDAEDPIG